MIALIATIRTKPGMGAEFEQAFLELAKVVKAVEPGNLLYQLAKSRTEDDTYKVLELYQDEEALAVHGKSDEFRAAGAKMGPSMAGRPEVERLDAVV